MNGEDQPFVIELWFVVYYGSYNPRTGIIRSSGWMDTEKPTNRVTDYFRSISSLLEVGLFNQDPGTWSQDQKLYSKTFVNYFSF